MLHIEFDQDWPTGLRDTLNGKFSCCPIFAVSINPQKLKSAKYFPFFEELLAYMVAVCGSYLFAFSIVVTYDCSLW